MSLQKRAIRIVFRGYKLVLSPLVHAIGGQGGGCRFQPTCSEYAVIAVSEHGLLRGGWMAIGRLARCHPFRQGGFDPVPSKHSRMCVEENSFTADRASTSAP